MSQPGKCYRCGSDPCTCGYENARKVLVTRLRKIGAEDDRNGYTALANAVATGEGVRIDSWIAMELIADAATLGLPSPATPPAPNKDEAR